VISASFVINKHTLLALALQMVREIELDGNLIRFALLNQFAYYSNHRLFPALLNSNNTDSIACSELRSHCWLYIAKWKCLKNHCHWL